MDRIILGDCLESLKTVPSGIADMCVTSPPYYALRDYGVDGQIGQEETPGAYIGRLASVFDEVFRVLRDDGTLWVNIGDSYNGHKVGNDNVKWRSVNTRSFEKRVCPDFKVKDLIGIPWMLAFELRRRGWYLRQDIIWHKPNPMPESVTDRCVKAHEYIFLLSKSPRYYFDHKAIQEKAITQSTSGSIRFGGSKYGDSSDRHYQTYSGNVWRPRTKNCMYDGQTPNTLHIDREEGVPRKDYLVRNKCDVWTVSPKPFKGAHFAVFPEDLITPCILAGSRTGGIVLDPFIGSGTTAVVAKRLGRRYLGCEMNPQYIEIANKRIAGVVGNLFYTNKNE